jgi:hypothetical protein
MSISNSAAVSSAVAATQSASAGQIQTMVLGVALQSEGQSALSLIQALPQPASLATSGSVGTRLNTYA